MNQYWRASQMSSASHSSRLLPFIHWSFTVTIPANEVLESSSDVTFVDDLSVLDVTVV